jgi:hypothetical protein
MAIFNSYVCLPDGIIDYHCHFPMPLLSLIIIIIDPGLHPRLQLLSKAYVLSTMYQQGQGLPVA